MPYLSFEKIRSPQKNDKIAASHIRGKLHCGVFNLEIFEADKKLAKEL